MRQGWTANLMLAYMRWRSGASQLQRRGVLDSWVGDTLDIGGHKAFRSPDGRNLSLVMPDGRLMPMIAGGGRQSWLELVDDLVADATQISNSTAEALLCPDFSFPGFYMVPGVALRVWAFGVCSNVVTTPGTLILRVRWGGLAGTVLLASAAQGLDTTARTNALWAMDARIVCRTAGATGTFISGGLMMNMNLLSSTAANLLPALLGSAGAPLASGNAAVTVDTTTTKLLSLTGQFSVATSPTNLTCQSRLLEVLN